MLGQKAGAALQEGDARAQAGKDLSQLQRHGTAADDQQGARLLRQGHGGGAGEHFHRLDAFQRQDVRARSGGQHDVLGAVEALAYGDAAFSLQPCPAAQQSNAVVSGQHVEVLLLAQALDEGLLLGDELGPVDAFLARVHAGKAVVAGLVVDQGGAHESLGGHAAAVDAGAADGAGFDNGHPRSQLGAADGGRHSPTAGANDQQVVVVHWLSPHVLKNASIRARNTPQQRANSSGVDIRCLVKRSSPQRTNYTGAWCEDTALLWSGVGPLRKCQNHPRSASCKNVCTKSPRATPKATCATRVSRNSWGQA